MAVEVDLSRLLLEAHPEDAARTLERLPDDQVAAVLEALPVAVAARVVGRMEPAAAAACLRGCSEEHAGRMLAALSADRAVAFVRRLDPDDRERLLAGMAKESARRLRRVLEHGEDTAGGLMEPAVLAFPEDIGAGEALRRARRHSRLLRYYAYVTDREHRLTGVLTLRELMDAPAERPLGALAHGPVERLHVRDGREAILRHPGWRSYHALPVVDDAGVVAGVLRYETLRRIEAEALERVPDLFVLGTALGQVWVTTTAALLDGLAASLRPGGVATPVDRKEANDGR